MKPLPPLSRRETLYMLRNALDTNIKNTVALTSKSATIVRGRKPELDQLLMQLVANQVGLMQGLREVLKILDDDFGHLLREDNERGIQ